MLSSFTEREASVVSTEEQQLLLQGVSTFPRKFSSMNWFYIWITSMDLPTDVPASGMYFMSYEWLQRVLTPEGQTWVCSLRTLDLLTPFILSVILLPGGLTWALGVPFLPEAWLVSSTGWWLFLQMCSSQGFRSVSMLCLFPFRLIIPFTSLRDFTLSFSHYFAQLLKASTPKACEVYLLKWCVKKVSLHFTKALRLFSSGLSPPMQWVPLLFYAVNWWFLEVCATVDMTLMNRSIEW